MKDDRISIKSMNQVLENGCMRNNNGMSKTKRKFTLLFGIFDKNAFGSISVVSQKLKISHLA